MSVCLPFCLTDCLSVCLITTTKGWGKGVTGDGVGKAQARKEGKGKQAHLFFFQDQQESICQEEALRGEEVKGG